MSINVSIDRAAKSETLNSTSILRIYEQGMMLKVMEKSNEPRLTQKNKFQSN